jgi:hypothetical protein
MESFVEALGGFAGGASACTILYPLEICKIRVQAMGGSRSMAQGQKISTNVDISILLSMQQT